MLNLVFALLLHPVHETVSEVQWNSESGCVEVALRLDRLDEQWIDKQIKSFKQTKPAEKRLAFLARHMRVAEMPKQGAADPCEYRWIGSDQDGAHVWWYFEIEPRDRMIPKFLTNTLLYERSETYVHRTLFLNQTDEEASRRTENLSRQGSKVPFMLSNSSQPAIESKE